MRRGGEGVGAGEAGTAGAAQARHGINTLPSPPGPDPGGRRNVCDPRGYLAPEEHKRVDGFIRIVGRAEKPPFRKYACGPGEEGVRVAVALVGRMRDVWDPAAMGAPLDDPLAESEALAKNIHDQWGVGNKACNNGILVFLVVEDRKVHISTGRGAKEIVSDEQARRIIDGMKRHLRAEDYLAALDYCIGQFYPDGGQTEDPPGWLGWFSDLPWEICIFFGVWSTMMVYPVVYQYLWGRPAREDCNRKLDNLDADRTQARAYPSYCNNSSCPICLNDYKKTDAPVVTLDCGHMFCEACIEQWRRRSHTCPLCRSAMEPTPDKLRKWVNEQGFRGRAPPPAAQRAREFLRHRYRRLRGQPSRPSSRSGSRDRGDTPLMSVETDRGTQAPRSRRTAADSSVPAVPGRFGVHHVYWNEYCFRAANLHHQHPRYVRRRMYNDITDDLWLDQLREDQHFREHESYTKAIDKDSNFGSGADGGSGGHDSFGGGSSSGGGGAGGSW